MWDEDALHRIITKFMLNTCRSTINAPPISQRKLGGFFANVIANILLGDAEALCSGSFAELYIRPILYCYGDIDIMHNSKTVLAIPYGKLHSIEFWNCHQDTVTVYEIIDSHKPGYVYLQQSYVVRKNENGRYVVQSLRNNGMRASLLCNSSNILNIVQQIFEKANMQPSYEKEIRSNLTTLAINSTTHGPAKSVRYRDLTAFHSNFDYVSCVFCPIWPPQATDWPTRNRHHGWPDQPTINMVVSGGCHVVGAVHPSCRDDHWECNYQWRLSFSRAEITLLNTWTPVQQIVYHMLRMILKREVFSEINDKGNLKFSNYHLKTEMLWACEQNPPTFWSEESSLVKLCSRLLLKLSDCVAERHCQHYFISSCNLLDYFFEGESWMICNNLRNLADESVLLFWFVQNYVSECARMADVPVLYEHYCSIDEVEKTANAIIDWKLSRVSYEMYAEYVRLESNIFCINFTFTRDALGTLTNVIMRELKHCDSRVRDYFVAVMSLRAAYTMSIHSLNDDLLEVLWTIFLPCDPATIETADSGLVSAREMFIRKAIKLIALSSVLHNRLGMIENEMAKAYLHQSLTCEQDSTYPQESCCLIHVLLGALYYKSGQYRSAIVNCKQVVNQPAYDDCGLCYLEAEQLPQIDTSVDSVFGLLLFYQYVRKSALNPDVQRQQDSKPVVTAELLAQYLYSICLTSKDDKRLQVKRHRHHLSCVKQPMLTDVLLFKSDETQLNEYAEIPVVADGTNDADNNASSLMDTSLLVTSLEQVALEKLINFRQLIVRELHSDQFPVVNEFELLYMYRHGMFQKCLRMCRNHINTLLNSVVQHETLSLHSPVYLLLFDGELLSLFGIIRILYPSGKYSFSVHISLLTVLLYLMIQCQKKLHSGSICDSLALLCYAHDAVFYNNVEWNCINRLILKLIYRTTKLYVDDCR